MILIVSKEEKELVTRLRALGADISGSLEKVSAYSAEVIALKKQIANLEIEKSQKEESFARQERELRHMIGLEKKRQEVEIEQARKETSLSVREGNLAADKKRFEEQLTFNTKRFETMEVYLKEMMQSILERLPNVNVALKRGK